MMMLPKRCTILNPTNMKILGSKELKQICSETKKPHGYRTKKQASVIDMSPIAGNLI